MKKSWQNSKIQCEWNIIGELKAKQGDVWRLLRILSEFVQGFDLLSEIGPSVTFFGSSRFSPENPYYRKAYETAYLFGKEGYTVVTGGGPGIMEAANKGAKEAGAESIGLQIDIPAEEGKNPYLTKSLLFKHFFVRKVMLLRYALGYVIFPGGYGTLDELFEALTLMQTKKMFPFPILLFGSDYWKPLVHFMRHTMVEFETIGDEDLNFFQIVDDPKEAVEIINRFVLEKSKHFGESFYVNPKFVKFLQKLRKKYEKSCN
ncbi:MAG TPA: TIGR00730 family Rossman fold protein [Aquifex aeolicus]|uniref:Cytokinin riboside 5'-monophosphate phosphoribohydrolase n=1 Tax=Aquifex aeolicus TaxID=63363 RepID=A0A9D0YNF7_AQUAO|nr:TIGR00730 family Rossman fold protein [Aquifex aeolicus]